MRTQQYTALFKKLFGNASESLSPAHQEAVRTINQTLQRAAKIRYQCNVCRKVYIVTDAKERAIYKCRNCEGVLGVIPQESVDERSEFEAELIIDEIIPPDVQKSMGESGNVMGKYVLLDRLGSGAMGLVYKAYDLELSRYVALKFIKSPNFEIVRSEAKATAALEHNNIAKIFEIGISSDGRCFIALQYVRGKNLAQVALTEREAVRIIHVVCRTIDYAHKRGFVHRDIKPENIMLDDEGNVFIMDFGLAVSSSKKGQIAGTPGFMAPEIALGREASIQSDIYSISATLYTLLCGQLYVPVNPGDDVQAIMMRICTGEGVPIRDRIPKISEQLEGIVMKGLSFDPSRRYQTAMQMAEDCEKYLMGEPVSAVKPTTRFKVGYTARKHKGKLIAGSLIATSVITMFLYFELYLPLVRDRERKTLVQSVLDRRIGIEREASVGIQRAMSLFQQGDFDGAIETASTILRNYQQYSTTEEFPYDSFMPKEMWDAELKKIVPFRIPIVDAHIIIAKALERKGTVESILDASKHYMRAFSSSANLGKQEHALFELGHFFLRHDDFDRASYFFKSLVDNYSGSRYASWAKYYMCFAYSGMGKYTEAAALIDEIMKSSIPPDLPSYRDFWSGQRIIPCFESSDRLNALIAASPSLAIFTGKSQKIETTCERIAAAFDIDGDGADELIVPYADAVTESSKTVIRFDIYAYEDGALRKLRRPISLPQPVSDMSDMKWFRFENGKNIGCVIVAGNIVKDGELQILKLENSALVKIYSDRITCNGRTLVSDIDRCGEPEIALSEFPARRLKIYKYSQGSFELRVTEDFGSDVDCMDVQDLDGDGVNEMIITTGLWYTAKGYRLWAVHPDFSTGDLKVIDNKPTGSASYCTGMFVATYGSGSGTVLFGTDERKFGGRHEERVRAVIGIDPNPRPRGGLNVADFRKGVFSKPRIEWSVPARTDDEIVDMTITRAGDVALVQAVSQGKVRKSRVIYNCQGELSYFPVHCEDVLFMSGRFCGPNATQLIGLSGKHLVVYGLPGQTSEKAQADSHVTPTVESGQQIRYRIASEVLTYYLEQEEFQTALDHLNQMGMHFPEYEREILMRRAEIYEKLSRWKDARDALMKIKMKFGLTEFEMAELTQRAAACKQMEDIRDHVAVGLQKFSSYPLLTNAPFAFRLSNDTTLTVFANPERHSLLAVPIDGDCSSTAIDASIKIERLDWSGSALIGLSSMLSPFDVDPLHDPWGYRLDIMSCMETYIPTGSIQVASYGRDGKTVRSRFFPSALPCDNAYQVSMESSSILKKVNLVFEAREGQQLKLLSRSSIGFGHGRAPKKGFFHILTTCLPGYTCKIRFDTLNLMAPSGSAAMSFQPEKCVDFFLRAGGYYVKGNFQSASEDYKTCLDLLRAGRVSDSELARLWFDSRYLFEQQTCYFLAFSLYHLGNVAEAEEVLLKSFTLNGNPDIDVALRLLLLNFGGMTDEELAFFGSVFLKMSKTMDPQFVVNSIFRTIPVYTPIFFEIMKGLLLNCPVETSLAEKVLNDVDKGLYNGLLKALSLSTWACLFKKQGQDSIANEMLKQALSVLESADVDDFYAFPCEKAINELRSKWNEY